ncbi:G patch domain-containing protein 3-like [Oratosquilla oratoria]|uniref:G patch domain-containing protein 3-like n=1 Tax=Oratosquilla oratoria TaxID=337810 RepID=UPI003F76539F
MMYVIVNNIPNSFHTPDLRNFFSDFVENSKFTCFHFRNRPEHQLFNPKLYEPDNDKGEEIQKSEDKNENESCGDYLTSSISSLKALIGESKKKSRDTKIYSEAEVRKKFAEAQEKNDSGEAKSTKPDRKCCVISLAEEHGNDFIRLYNKKHWVDREGNPLPLRCIISKIEVTGNEISAPSSADCSVRYLTRGEERTSKVEPTIQDIKKMIEFRPPHLMPKGNVGTPTKYFLEMIRTCKLPPRLIGKLGLELPRTKRKKRYSQVPFDYGTTIQAGNEEGQNSGYVFTGRGHAIPLSVDFSKERRKRNTEVPKMMLETEKEDGAEVEEWERYEAFHNDVTSQERTRERRYEKEIELVWEKGGPGLVFYTDTQFWRELEGGFDEQTADEWDVDMSTYYGEGGDMDARDSVAMRRSDQLRRGELQESVFTPQEKAKNKRKKIKGPQGKPPEIGQFEEHTRGIGRRIMESQGWSDGQGLGCSQKGMPYTIENDGKHPSDKKGIGYYGEKMQSFRSQASGRRQNHDFMITTAFDQPKTVDKPEPLLRSHEPVGMKQRVGSIVFRKEEKE